MLALLLLGLSPATAQPRIVASRPGSPPTRAVLVLETDDHRMLLSDHAVIGCEHREALARGQAAFAGMALMETIAFLRPAPHAVLCLGLGAGTVPAALRSAGIRVDAVERDPAIIGLASAHFLFGMAPRPADAAVHGGGRVIRADAHELLAEDGADDPIVQAGGYDVILSDLWDGDNPSLTLPYLQEVRSGGWLARNRGVVAISVVAFVDGPHVALALAVVATVRAAFGHVACFVDADPSADEWEAGAAVNLLVFGSDGPLRFEPPTHAAEAGTIHHLHANFQRWAPAALRGAAEGTEGVPVADDAGWERLNAEREAVVLAMRAQQRQLLPDDAWALVDAAIDAGGEVAEGAGREEEDDDEFPPRSHAPGAGRPLAAAPSDMWRVGHVIPRKEEL